jgi:hypothetical protein
MPGRQVHSFVLLRRTRYSPLGDDGQSSSVASFVINVGPARSASVMFSASMTSRCDSAFCAKAGCHQAYNCDYPLPERVVALA